MSDKPEGPSVPPLTDEARERVERAAASRRESRVFLPAPAAFAPMPVQLTPQTVVLDPNVEHTNPHAVLETVEERVERELTVTPARPSWDGYFIKMTHAVAERATCDRKHVGCVLVFQKRIIATGYNGSVPGLPHCDDVGHDMVNGHCVRTVHAEVNAIAQASRAGIRTDGATAYVNTYPCWPCFKILALAGIERIVYDDNYRNDERVQEAAREAFIRIERFTV